MEQADLLSRTLSTLTALGIDSMLVGSMASMSYGEPRLTRDIDLVVSLRDADVQPLCDAFSPPEFYVSVPAARDAVRTASQFNIIQLTTSLKIDVMVRKNNDWAREQWSRRQKVEVFPGAKAYCASPEDVILGKLIYYQIGEHEKHLRDIAGMLRVSGDLLDRDYLELWATKLGVDAIWNQIVTDERTD